MRGWDIPLILLYTIVGGHDDMSSADHPDIVVRRNRYGEGNGYGTGHPAVNPNKRKRRRKRKRAVDPLIRALRSDNPNVRVCAVFALGKTGDERYIPYLERMEDDHARPRCSDMTVGEVASDILENLRSRKRNW
jgi:hypothetical protein